MKPSMLAIVLVLLACNEPRRGGSDCSWHGMSYALGEVFPAGDGCNSCVCSARGVSCSEAACFDGGVDANPASCAASGGCPEGPACGARCCGAGERCVNGTCQCGSAPACGDGEGCQPLGPTGPDQCGAICCASNCPQ